jgi:hypothetical protein
MPQLGERKMRGTDIISAHYALRDNWRESK